MKPFKAVFPGKYIQAEGAVAQLPELIRLLGTKSLILASPTVVKSVLPGYNVKQELKESVIINEFNMDSAVTLMKLNHDENAIVELTVPKGSSVEQVAIKDLAIPADTILIAVHRQGENIIPNGQTVLQAKDHILAYTNSSGQKQLEALFT